MSEEPDPEMVIVDLDSIHGHAFVRAGYTEDDLDDIVEHFDSGKPYYHPMVTAGSWSIGEAPKILGHVVSLRREGRTLLARLSIRASGAFIRNTLTGVSIGDRQ